MLGFGEEPKSSILVLGWVLAKTVLKLCSDYIIPSHLRLSAGYVSLVVCVCVFTVSVFFIKRKFAFLACQPVTLKVSWLQF